MTQGKWNDPKAKTNDQATKAVAEKKKQENLIDNEKAKASLMGVLTSHFETFIKWKKYQSYTNKAEMFEEFINYLNKVWKTQVLSILKDIFWDDVKWEAVVWWNLDEAWTVEKFMNVKIEKKLKEDMEKAMCQSFKEKYISLVKSNPKWENSAALFPADFIENIDIELWVSIDKLKDLKDLIFALAEKYKLSITDETKEFLQLNWKVSNDNIVSFMKQNWAIDKVSYDELFVKQIADLTVTNQNLISSLTKCNMANMLEDNLDIANFMVKDFSKFLEIPWISDIISSYPKFSNSDLQKQIAKVKKESWLKDLSEEKQRHIAYIRLMKIDDTSKGLSQIFTECLEKFILWETLPDYDKKVFIDRVIDFKTSNKWFENFCVMIWIDENNKSLLIDFLKNLYGAKSSTKLSIPEYGEISFEFFDKILTVDQESLSWGLNDIKFLFWNMWRISTLELESKKDFYLTFFKDYFSLFGSWNQSDKKLFLPNWLWKDLKWIDLKFKKNWWEDLQWKIVLSWDRFKLIYPDGSEEIMDKSDINVDSYFEFTKWDDKYSLISYDTVFNQEDLWRLIYMQAWFLWFDSKSKQEKIDRQSEIMQKTIEQNFTLKSKQQPEEIVDSKSKDSTSIIDTVTQNNEDFKKEWDEIHWEKKVEFKPWAQLFLRWMDSFIKLGWWSFWIRLEVTEVSDHKFKFKIYGTEVALAWVTWSFEWKEFELDKTADALNQLKSNFSNTVLRYNKIENLSGFMEKVQNADVTDYKKMKTGKDLWQSLKLENWKVLNSEWKPITHIWKQFTDYSLSDATKKFEWFEVIFNDTTVTLKWTDLNYTRIMDYNSFLVMYSEKQLQAYTKDEFENNKKLLWDEQEKTAPTMPLLMLSWANILSSFKSVKDWISNKMKKTDDLRTAKFYNQLVNSYAFKATGSMLWLVSFGLLKEPFTDLQIEAISELDSQVWKIIKDHKDKLWREGSVHAGRISDVIKNDIFEQKNIYDSNPFKAIWYLLYSLESWWGPYFRNLKKEAWKWIWVRSILWPKHHEKFMNLLKVKEAALRANPTDENLLDELMRLEIWYVKWTLEKDEYKVKYGAKVAVEIEVAFTNNLSKSKALDVEKDEEKKSSFSEIYGAYSAYLKNLRWANTLWALWALTKNFDTEDEYNKWYWAMLMPVLTWTSKVFWDDNSKKLYRGMARSNGFALWLYIRDANGPEKILRLIDYACKKAWIADTFSKSIWFNKIWDDYDLSKISLGNYWSNFSDIIKDFEKWWWMYGSKIIPILNIKDLTSWKSLLNDLADFKDKTIPADKKLDKKTGDALKEYADKKLFETDTGTHTVKIEYYSEWDPHYPDVMFNLSSWFFANIMLPKGGHVKPEAIYMWNTLYEKINWLSKGGKLDKVAFNFIFKKYVSWVRESYWEWTWVWSLVASMYTARESYNWWKPDLSKRILSHIISWNFKWYRGTPELIQTMEAFEKLFLNNIENIDKDLLLNVFGSDYENYLSIEAFRGAKIWKESLTQQQENINEIKDDVAQAFWLPKIPRNNQRKNWEDEEYNNLLDWISN